MKREKNKVKNIDFDQLIIDKFIKSVKEYISYCKNRIKALEKEIKNLKSNKAYKKLESDYNKFRENSIYEMSDKEKSLLEKFKKKHNKCCKNNGNQYSYIFYGDGIGTWLDVKCEKCNEKIEIFDEGKW